jgi:hypothetical protein
MYKKIKEDVEIIIKIYEDEKKLKFYNKKSNIDLILPTIITLYWNIYLIILNITNGELLKLLTVLLFTSLIVFLFGYSISSVITYLLNKMMKGRYINKLTSSKYMSKEYFVNKKSTVIAEQYYNQLTEKGKDFFYMNENENLEKKELEKKLLKFNIVGFKIKDLIEYYDNQIKEDFKEVKIDKEYIILGTIEKILSNINEKDFKNYQLKIISIIEENGTKREQLRLFKIIEILKDKYDETILEEQVKLMKEKISNKNLNNRSIIKSI